MAGLGRFPKLDVADSIPVSRSNPCRLLLIASGLTLLWAWSILFSGGFIFRIGQLRISSRNSNNPLVLALLALAAALVVAPRGRRWRTAVGEFNEFARTLERRLPRLAPPQTRALITGTVFVSAVLLSMPARLPRGARWLAVVVLVGTGAAHAVAFGRANSSFDSAMEWRYATAGRYIAEKLPERAVLFTMLHSGSARYYSGRLTVRYDLIPPQLFERAIAHFQQQGFVPFLLLDDGERGHFVDRFTGATSLAALDWQPVATLDGVAVYAATAK